MTLTGGRRFSVAQLLVAIVVAIGLAPFLDQVPNGNLIEAIIVTVVLLSAVVAVGGRRRTLILAVLLVLPALAGRWVDHLSPDDRPSTFTLVAGMLFVGFIVGNLMRFIMLAPRVDGEILCASVANYLLLGIWWALAFRLVDLWVPGAFRFTIGPEPTRPLAAFEAAYFSYSTLTTVAYGDIIPATQATRLLAIAEATVGMFYVTLLIARLVSLYAVPESHDNGERPA